MNAVEASVIIQNKNRGILIAFMEAFKDVRIFSLKYWTSLAVVISFHRSTDDSNHGSGVNFHRSGVYFHGSGGSFHGNFHCMKLLEFSVKMVEFSMEASTRALKASMEVLEVLTEVLEASLVVRIILANSMAAVVETFTEAVKASMEVVQA